MQMYIYLDYESVQQLMQKYGVSRPYLSRVLRYNRNSINACLIRHEAMNFCGGKLVRII